MKVKNIMFSGFMAAVLAGACGAADAATVLASKEFVVEKLADKQDNLTAGTGIDITNNVVSSTYSDAEIKEDIQALETTIGASKESLGGKTIVQYIDDKTKGFESDGVVSELQSDVSAIEGKLAGLGEGKTVAQEIADAVGGKQDKLTFDDTPMENSANPVKSGGVYAALSGKADVDDIPTNVSAFTNDANYVTSTELDGMGYQTAGEVNTAIGNANIAMEKVTGLGAALEGKASTGDVSALSGKVDGLAEKAVTTDNMDTALAGYVTSTELDGMGYQTAGEVNTAIGNANIAMEKVTGLNTALDGKAAADVVESLKTTVDGWTNATTGIAATYATKSEFNTYKGEVTDALGAKVDDADLNNYYTKTQADEKFLEDAGLENGAAYLVTKNSEGKVVYSEVSVIGENGQTVIGKAQQL